MSRITLTRELAFASGQDAANAQMRKAGRVKWNEADRDLATSTTNRFLLHVPFEQGGLRGLPLYALLNHVEFDEISRAGIVFDGHNGGPMLDAAE